MKPIIRAENISKQYRLGAGAAAQTLRDAMAGAVRRPLERLRRGARARGETIWALRDASFEIGPGEVVGIIGHNGAGKSTLLKILSRITEPTAGRIELYGNIGSLLEVGTGFHPELTGRENIYLNGSILGMKKAEIDRKFDEIVAFAEVEKFLDTPVKHFSSGMYTRLAFSVAAHFEPEILIVDEVLAVGDAGFQRKSLEKMQDIARHGRTVLFVSHNLRAIARLCPRNLLLSGGRVVMDGPPHEVISAYLDAGLEVTAAREWADPEQAPGDDTARLRAVRLLTEDGGPADLVDIRRPFVVEIEYDVLKPGRALSGNFLCYDEEGVCVFSSTDLSPASVYGQDVNFTGRRVTRCEVPGNLMAEGRFLISVSVFAILNEAFPHVNIPEVVGFQVYDPGEGDSARGIFTGPFAGVMRPLLTWTTDSIPFRVSRAS